MKTKFLVVAISVVCFFACRKPSVVPKVGDEQQSIASLKALYSGAPTEIRDNILITGTVISSDREGNFYHTLVLEDASGGIEVKLGMDEIFKQFLIHSRATVRCQGLWLGSYGGTLQIGAQPTQTFETQPLTDNQIAEHLLADTTFYEEVRPRILRISELSSRDVSTFVAIENVRFASDEQGLSWSEPDADTDRYIIDSQGYTLIVRTSSYADFASWTLPSGMGRIEGVVAIFNGHFQLVVTDATRFFAEN